MPVLREAEQCTTVQRKHSGSAGATAEKGTRFGTSWKSRRCHRESFFAPGPQTKSRGFDLPIPDPLMMGFYKPFSDLSPSRAPCNVTSMLDDSTEPNGWCSVLFPALAGFPGTLM
ncbi:MltA domain protein [Anopheles sinensis]|uniref:MltA domain protein n=1 Tax=Anopheles sinensis TaxID=74873 RepID=A0A084VKM8_ANOSI|nr:MltA domain protein [Anopheles sinensis]